MALGGARDFMLEYCVRIFSRAFCSALDWSEDSCLAFGGAWLSFRVSTWVLLLRPAGVAFSLPSLKILPL